MKAKIFGPTDEQTTRLFRKMHYFKSAILPYQNSLERKNFVKFKRTQLFYLVIKSMKPFAVPSNNDIQIVNLFTFNSLL